MTTLRLNMPDRLALTVLAVLAAISATTQARPGVLLACIGTIAAGILALAPMGRDLRRD